MLFKGLEKREKIAPGDENDMFSVRFRKIPSVAAEVQFGRQARCFCHNLSPQVSAKCLLLSAGTAFAQHSFPKGSFRNCTENTSFSLTGAMFSRFSRPPKSTSRNLLLSTGTVFFKFLLIILPLPRLTFVDRRGCFSTFCHKGLG